MMAVRQITMRASRDRSGAIVSIATEEPQQMTRVAPLAEAMTEVLAKQAADMAGPSEVQAGQAAFATLSKEGGGCHQTHRRAPI